MISFGTLGVARITTRALVYPTMDENRARIVAIAARDKSRAERFAEFANIAVVLDNYQAVIDYDGINAVYIPLPITAHCEWAVRALRAGKHVLCEKSFAANAAEAETMAQVATECDRIIMDAFHYRYHPVFLRAREIYLSGELGEIKSLDAGFQIPGNGIKADDIRMNYDQGGGVTMDIGCYPISWVRHITGAEPLQISASAVIGPPNVDLMLTASMIFPGGISASTIGDMRPDTPFRADLKVEGSLGAMVVNNPLVPQNGNSIVVTTAAGTRTETFDRRPTYGYQLDAFINAVESGTSLLTGPQDAIAQMRVIDACYESAGLPPRGMH